MVQPSHYLEIKADIEKIALKCGRDPQEITLLAVSKYQPVEAMEQVYQEGCRHFGESRLQEAQSKISVLPSDIEWHFIGHLQKNKARKILQLFQLIHSVDDLDLALHLNAISLELGKKTSVLLQVNVLGEDSKQGLDASSWRRVLDQVAALPNLQLRGLMTMAPLTTDLQLIRHCFMELRLLKEEFQKNLPNSSLFDQLSMGMSQDYRIAIEEGATCVRIGSAIFKEYR